MDTLETLITSESIVSLLMVSTELKETMRSTASGCGEEHKFQKNGKNIKATTISHSLKWTQLKKLTKSLLKSIGSTPLKEQWYKESQSLMPIGSNERKCSL